jgi:hypothetical protein
MTESLLRYHTGEFVHLGDHIRIRRFLRRPFVATIIYLSGACAPHDDLEVDGLATLAVEHPEGTVIAWNREMGGTLEKRFELVTRGVAERVLSPSRELL